MKNLVTEVKPENCVTYGSLVVGFYDNPRTLTDATGKKIEQDRLYIDIATPNAKQQHVKRKAHEDEPKKYSQAYNKYLEVKENGGSSISDSDKDAEIARLRKELAKKQEAAKIDPNEDAVQAEIAKAAKIDPNEDAVQAEIAKAAKAANKK